MNKNHIILAKSRQPGVFADAVYCSTRTTDIAMSCATPKAIEDARIPREHICKKCLANYEARMNSKGKTARTFTY